MTTVAEIEAAIRQLPEDEARQLSAWLVSYLDDAWDAQMQAEKLDGLIEKTEAAIAAGKVRDLDDTESQAIPAKRSWLELEGIAAGSGTEENAQAWMTQTRDEWDDRESQWQTSA